jgi:hypothetical protein
MKRGTFFPAAKLRLTRMSHMTRTQNNVSPEIAGQLAQIAREMRLAIYGSDGFPVWGTRFDDIEQQAMDIGHEMARLFMEQAVDQQAQSVVPPDLLEPGDETANLLGTDHPTQLETPAGEIQWDQPKARQSQARRDFFPSGQSTGRGC